MAAIITPNVFVANTKAQAAPVNANFAEYAAKALNKTGDIMTGNLGLNNQTPIHPLDVNGIIRDKGYIGAARLAMGSRAAFAYDDFDRANQTLSGTLTPTGQTWNISGAGAAGVSISDGKMVATDNYYASLDSGGLLTRFGGTFSFGTGAGTDRDGTSMTLIGDRVNNALQDMFHMTFGPNAWNLQKRLAGGAFVTIATGVLNLLTDGTVYPIALEINTGANTATVIAPDGTRTTVTDADVSVIAARYAEYQYTGDATTGFKGAWHSVSIGKSKAEALRAEGLGAGLADLTLFTGSGLTLRRKITGTVTGAGWYRISTRSAMGTFAIAGNIKITATDAARATFWDVDVHTQTGGATSSLVQRYGATYSGGPITQLRLSRLDASSLIGLDMNIPNALAVTFSIEFNGAFTPVTVPVVGATVYADGANTLTISATNNFLVDVIGGNAAGLTLNANGTNQSIYLNPSGAGVSRGHVVIPNTMQLKAVGNAAADFPLIGSTSTNVVEIGGTANRIRWGDPVKALGGGAAATLGTIGGTGPTIAGQNSWIPIQDSDGNSKFVPAWL